MNKDEFKILVVDDEEGMREGLEKALLLEGFFVQTAANAAEALQKLGKGGFDLAFIDYKLPDLDGIEIIKRCETEQLNIVVITAFASIENAITAMKLGASDYLIKPFTNREIIEIACKYYKQKSMVGKENHGHRTDDFIYVSETMKSVVDNAKLIAGSPIPVLIEGESGTGKEMIAKFIYREGGFEGKPFVGINCAAIPSELLESELFGYEKGAFSGAHQTKIGKFESAEDGMVFLDEIGDMSIELQAKLLRVLEEKSFERIGGLKTIAFQARVISSTNIDLRDHIQKGNFRSDLYFRLKGIQLHIPALRERDKDIEVLAHHFLDHYRNKYQKEALELSAEALRKLKRHSWPGNVRELKHVIESTVLLAGSKKKILSEDLPIESGIDSNSINIQELERASIMNALVENHFNRSLAAKSLQISRKTLYSKMKRYSIEF
jgi:two-component system, NtrC family, response regulator AtoC